MLIFIGKLMSYIVGFVKFSNYSTKSYPVECYREDLSEGDSVIIEFDDGRFHSAILETWEYLNWECKHRIFCKASEFKQTDQVIKKGFSDSKVLIDLLVERNWHLLSYRNKTYKAVLNNSNNTQTANILFRKNGIDIQLLEGKTDSRHASDNSYDGSLSEGKVVRNYYAHTEENLLEHILRFSDVFMANKDSYDDFFIFKGSKDKSVESRLVKSDIESIILAEDFDPNSHLMENAEEDEAWEELENEFYDDDDDDESYFRKGYRDELYETVCHDDSDEPAYLGDGMWISSDGSLEDRG